MEVPNCSRHVGHEGLSQALGSASGFMPHPTTTSGTTYSTTVLQVRGRDWQCRVGCGRKTGATLPLRASPGGGGGGGGGGHTARKPSANRIERIWKDLHRSNAAASEPAGAAGGGGLSPPRNGQPRVATTMARTHGGGGGGRRTELSSTCSSGFFYGCCWGGVPETRDWPGGVHAYAPHESVVVVGGGGGAHKFFCWCGGGVGGGGGGGGPACTGIRLVWGGGFACTRRDRPKFGKAIIGQVTA